MCSLSWLTNVWIQQNQEQLTMFFHWVDLDLEVHEDFVGVYQIPDITANTIVQALKDCDSDEFAVEQV